MIEARHKAMAVWQFMRGMQSIQEGVGTLSVCRPRTGHSFPRSLGFCAEFSMPTVLGDQFDLAYQDLEQAMKRLHEVLDGLPL